MIMYALALYSDSFLSACGQFRVHDLAQAKFFVSEDEAYGHRSRLNDVWSSQSYPREITEDEKKYLRGQMLRKRREVEELERFLK